MSNQSRRKVVVACLMPLMVSVFLGACRGDAKIVTVAGNEFKLSLHLTTPADPNPLDPPASASTIFGAYNITVRSDSPRQEFEFTVAKTSGGEFEFIAGDDGSFTGFRATDNATAEIEVTNGLDSTDVYGMGRTSIFAIEDGAHNVELTSLVAFANTWSELETLAEGRIGAGSADLGARGLLIAGGSSAGTLRRGMVYHNGVFEVVNDVALERKFPTVVGVGGGRALIAGGIPASGTISAAAALFDGNSGTVAAVNGSVHAHAGAAGIYFPEADVVVVVGGFQDDVSNMVATDKVSVIDVSVSPPVASVLSLLAETPRAFASVTVLAGVQPTRALITGGVDTEGGVALSSAVLVEYTAGAPKFTAVASAMSVGRVHHAVAALPLSNGQALIHGGSDGTAVLADPAPEIYDIILDTFAPVDAPRDDVTVWGPRAGATAVALADGSVLLSGGLGVSVTDADPILYQPALDDFHAVQAIRSPLPRVGGLAHVRGDGSVVLVGGDALALPLDSDANAVATVEVFVPR